MTAGMNTSALRQVQLIWITAFIFAAACLLHVWRYNLTHHKDICSQLNISTLRLTPPGLSLETTGHSHHAVDLRFHPMLPETRIEKTLIRSPVKRLIKE